MRTKMTGVKEAACAVIESYEKKMHPTAVFF
jgi:hypothetical protein